MKKRLIGLFIIICIVFVSCVDEKELENPVEQKTIQLSELEGSVEIYDFTDYGLWSVSLNKRLLINRIGESEHYSVTIDNVEYMLSQNPLNASILEVFLSSELKEEQIKNAIISFSLKQNISEIRGTENLSVKYIYLERKDDDFDKHGTDLYELSLTNYLSLKNADNAFVFKDGCLIRPSFVKTSERNAYSLKRYLNARQVSEGHDMTSAFEYLKNNPSHESLLFFENPNRVRLDTSIQITEPDVRDRLRQLGTMGIVGGTNSYDIVDDLANSRKIIYIKNANFPDKYTDTYFYELAFDDATICEFNFSSTPGIQTADVYYTETKNQELIKNARINVISYNTPVINATLPENGAFFETNTINLTWNATPGEVLSAVDTRGRSEITEYRIYLATVTSDYPQPSTVTSKNFVPQNLKWGSTYKWKVEVVQNNEKYATSTEKQFELTNLVGVYNNAGVYQNSYESIQTALSTNPENGSVLKVFDDMILSDQIDIVGEELTICSSNESKMRELNAQDNGRGFVITGDSSITLKNLTIKNCTMNDISGAALSTTESTLTLLNCIVDSNRVDKNTNSLVYGGGLYANHSSVQIENSTFTANYAWYSGGAIAVYNDSELLIKASIIKNNGSYLSTGGIWVTHNSSATIINSEFENNKFSSLDLSSDSTATVDHSVFARGASEEYSLALFVNNGCDLRLTNSTVTDYTKTSYGAVTLNWNPIGDNRCEAHIYGNVFKNCNSYNKEAGGIYAFSNTDIYNSNGEKWRVANSPDNTVEYVENTTVDNNKYENITFKGNPDAIGAKIFFKDAP